MVPSDVDLGPPRVVHCLREPYHHYVGRGRDPHTGIPGRLGNPFRIGYDGNRDEVIDKYELWVPTQRWLLELLAQLRGLTFGCWCHPEPCHGDVLIRLANPELARG